PAKRRSFRTPLAESSHWFARPRWAATNPRFCARRGLRSHFVTQTRRLLGARGEAAVAAWYEARGFTVLARNWHCRDGELDLVVRDGRQYVFCEMKSRTTELFGAPIE